MHSATQCVEGAHLAVPRLATPAADEAQLLAVRYVALRYYPLRGAMWRLPPSPGAEAPLRARLPPAGLLPTLKADAVFLSPPWGGLHYDERAQGAFDLTADLQPCCGFDLFDAACTAACSTRRPAGATQLCYPGLGRTPCGLGCSTHSWRRGPAAQAPVAAPWACADVAHAAPADVQAPPRLRWPTTCPRTPTARRSPS